MKIVPIRSFPSEAPKPPDPALADSAKRAGPAAGGPVDQNAIRFSVDAGSGKKVITIVNQKSGDVIRQIPPEEVVALSKFLGSLQGNFLNRIG
ncbi:MAG: flagellar protein FlaG [Nitrospirae bacterium]|nr:flagellar protein FlaG [Nitrospirota bacterium]